MESFVVVCDSNFNYSAGAGTYARQYYFDWSVIPDGKYAMSFSFVSEASTAVDVADLFSVFSNIISPQNVYHASGNIGARTTAHLGNVNPVPFNTTAQTSNYLFCDVNTNPPVIVNRPMTNIFTINIFDGMSANPSLTTPNYILTLHFKPLRLALA